MRRWTLAPLVVMLAGASPSHRPVPAPIDRPGTPAADSVDRLARDVQRLESLRAVKNLQRAYAQYGQAGQWREMAALFAARGRIEWGGKRIAGQGAIAAWLGQRGHGGRPGTLATELIDEPLVTLSADGTSAQGRWMSLSLLGDGQGNARIEGGVYENDYVRGPRGWRIATARYFPQFEGGYAEGWTNIGGRDLPVVPYRITPDQTGIPVPPASGPAPKTGASLAEIQRRILALNDEDAVRNVQNAYGYYVDRKMWDDVVDLFAPDAVAEIGASGRQRRPAGVRRALARMGSPGLRHGELNDRPLFDTIVRVLPGGREAESRGIELGMLGDADKGTAEWEISVFRNRFVKQGGLWKLSELRVVPLLRADYYVGWGKGAQRVQVPALLGPALAPSRTAIHAPAKSTLADARRRLQRSLAYDAVENVSSAYGLYIDDFQWPQMGAIFAVNGNKQSPFVGYYLGRDRIMGAVNATWGPPPETRPGISYHWRTQPVIHVSHDARSANLRTRLFQPRTSKEPSKAGQFYAAGFHGGMYPNDQLVLEDGIWRLWSLTIDEPYFFSVDWKSGWSAAKDPKDGTAPNPSPLFRKYPPDIPITALGRREEGFRGGTGKTITWPGILPMWFHYRNPVSGRMPDNYWPDCVPCVQVPQASMTRHGYQMPPNGPEIDGVEVAR